MLMEIHFQLCLSRQRAKIDKKIKNAEKAGKFNFHVSLVEKLAKKSVVCDDSSRTDVFLSIFARK